MMASFWNSVDRGTAVTSGFIAFVVVLFTFLASAKSHSYESGDYDAENSRTAENTTEGADDVADDSEETTGREDGPEKAERRSLGAVVLRYAVLFVVSAVVAYAVMVKFVHPFRASASSKGGSTSKEGGSGADGIGEKNDDDLEELMKYVNKTDTPF